MTTETEYMHGVFLLNDKGDTIFSAANGKLEGDASMMGGLIGALQMLVSKASCDQIKTVILDDLEMHLRRAGPNQVVTLHDVGDNTAEIKTHRIAKFIEDNPSIGSTEGFMDLINTMISREPDSI